MTYSFVAPPPPPPTTGNATLLTISGLPSGVQASIGITGPGSYSNGLVGTKTLSGLMVGTYTFTADNVNTNGVTYIPSPATQAKGVTAGSTTALSVVYSTNSPPPPPPPTTGSAAITISGLPSGVLANMSRVTGPASLLART